MAGIEVFFGANTEQLEAAIARSKSQLRQFGKEARTGVNSLAKYGAAAAAAGTAITAGLVAKGLDAVDVQAKLARQLGTTSSSIATLNRAAELSGVSMEKIRSGTRQLTVRLAQAASGTGPAVEALNQLGLSANRLSQIPLDQRIRTINQAIQDQIPASQQAATAAKLFGEEAGLAFSQINAETLTKARREAELFGTAVSDFDASQVEAANDAMSTIGTAVEGVTKQLAIQMAPILEGIAALFVDAAEEAGGVGEATSDAFGFIVESTAQVINAVDGIRRVFSVVADGIIMVWNSMASKITGIFKSVLESISNDVVPGMDFSETIKSLENFSTQAGSIADMAGQNIQDTLMNDMAGEKFKEFVAEQKERARKAKEEFKGLQVQDIVYGTPEEQEKRDEEETERAEKRQELILQRQKNFEEMKKEIETKRAKERQEEQDRINRLKEKGEADFWSNSTSLMNSGSRKMFEIGKAASYAQAVVKGWSAAQSAWDAGMATGGPYAPAVAAAYTAASLAKTGAQLQAIKSASFGGGGSSGGGGGTPTGNINAIGEGVAAQQIQRNTSIDISLIGADNRDRAVAGSIISQLNDEIEAGGRISRVGLA